MYLSPLVIFLLQTLHVLCNMTTKYVLLQYIGIQLFTLLVITWESLFVVRNVETTVAGALESTEYTRTGGSSLETNIKVDLEWSGCIFVIEGFGGREFAVWLRHTLIFISKAEFCQSSPSSKETSCIGYPALVQHCELPVSCTLTSSPVSKAMVNSIPRELFRPGSRENIVSRDTSVDDLHDDFSVGESDNESIFWRVAVGDSS